MDGIKHEFSTITGVVEDVADFILNLKQVRVKPLNVGAADLGVCLDGILNAFVAQWLIHEPQAPVAEHVARLRGTILSLILRKRD